MVSADPIVAATTNTDLPDTGSTVADIGEFALIDSCLLYTSDAADE